MTTLRLTTIAIRVSAATLTRTPEGKYRIQAVGSDTDFVDFDTAQDAIDCWDWTHADEPLDVNIDRREDS